MTTARPTRDQTHAAIALFRDALTGDGMYYLLNDYVHGADVTRADIARALLAHPTLARVIAIGQAWVAVEAALPEGWSVFGVRMFNMVRAAERYRATAYSDDHNAGRYDGYGPTPEAALLALAAALTDQERGS